MISDNSFGLKCAQLRPVELALYEFDLDITFSFSMFVTPEICSCIEFFRQTVFIAIRYNLALRCPVLRWFVAWRLYCQ